MFSFPPPSQDILYDREIGSCASRGGLRGLRRSLLGQEYVRRVMEGVFRRHGAVHVDISHLLPKGEHELYDRPRSNLVEVMTHSGAVVRLPYDLRVSFARFLARSRVTHMKRYSVAPVFREIRPFGCHPREEIECAFDIVTPAAGGGVGGSDGGGGGSGSLLADAEVLYLTDELLREFPAIPEASYFFRLNHTALLSGILTSCGVSEEYFKEIYHVIREGERWTYAQRREHLQGLGMQEQGRTDGES